MLLQLFLFESMHKQMSSFNVSYTATVRDLGSTQSVRSALNFHPDNSYITHATLAVYLFKKTEIGTATLSCIRHVKQHICVHKSMMDG